MEECKLARKSNRGAGIGKLVTTTAISSLALAVAAASAQADEALADLVEQVAPSVVTVLARQEMASEVSGMDLQKRFGIPEGSHFEDFFKNFGPGNSMPDQFGNDQPREGLGSGFILDPEGWLVTNHHVVDGADSVTVRLSDGRTFDAEIVGVDDKTNLALLSIEADDALPYVKLGDSDEIRVGEDVMAVGNPFGLGGTVTSGIVSAKGRNISDGPYAEFLQTDAAINKGNSGGPLFNMDGEVVGVNSAIYSPTGGSVGVGFAVTSNIVDLIVDDLKEDGKIDRGWLGVAIQDVTPELAAALGLNAPTGALVASVLPDSPADGEILAGDVILEFGGKKVPNSSALPKLVAATEDGAEADIVVYRSGDEKVVKVEIDALRTAQRSESPEADEDRIAALQTFGATVAELDDNTRAKTGLDDTTTGVVVTSVDVDGPAARAGVQVGDIILRIGDQKVGDTEALKAALAGDSTTPSLLLVNRGGRQVFLAVEFA